MMIDKLSVAILVLCPCLFAAEESDSPAAPATRPAATQPAAPTLPRYFNLLKNEFMEDEDDNIVLVPEDLNRNIDQIRKAAADEKRALDEEIAELTRQIKVAESNRKNSLEQARQEAKAARKADKRSVRYSYTKDGLGRTTSFNASTDYIAASARDGARRRADERKAQADKHSGDIAAMRADLISLKKESAALAAVASPHNRNLPPKTYWTDLPDDIQRDLKRVGITLDQFKRVLRDMGMSEEAFLEDAFELDKEAEDTDELIDELRKMFAKKMPPPAPKRTSPKSTP